MTLLHVGTRPFRGPAMVAKTIVLLLTVLPMLLARPAVAQQPLPIRELAYSAKFLCGAGTDGDPADGSLPADAGEMTVIEIHNPHSFPVTITIKWIQDYPSYQIGIPPYSVTLPSNGALNLDCEDWELPGCPPICGSSWRGFVEIRTPQQLKVVALYKEMIGGHMVSASIAKENCLPFLFGSLYRHSAAYLVGDQATNSGDTIQHETTVTMTNMSNNTVNANVFIVSSAGTVTSFPRSILPHAVSTVTKADLPPAVPRPFVGSVLVEYPQQPGFGALLSCEEIIQKHLIGGPPSIAMSVVEVQPIPLR
ncbi:MAG TPA: hypothetical protein VJY35_04060 [Candidatus Eisenbacteria bacterium]|nr:hypothetical protein [Candidatus Eisenbacteria bacterium]